MTSTAATTERTYQWIFPESFNHIYDTRFVKPVKTVERIYKKAKDGSDGGDAGRFTYTHFNDSEMSGVLYYAGGTTIGLGTKVFKDDKLEAAAGDGNYRNDTNRLTVSGGEVVDYKE